MILPNYESGSIVNLISSLMAYYKIKNNYKPLEDFKIPIHKRLVFMVIDGLGLSFLETHGKNSFLHKLTKSQLTSVFPSTTAAALTSLMTGQAPLQHGLTGWFMYFKELATAGIPLPFSPRFTDKSFCDLDVKIEEIFDFQTIFKKINNSMLVLSPKQSIDSPFSKYCFGNKAKNGFETFEECFELIKNQVINHPTTEMIYVYIPHFDECAHHYGINSVESIEMFNKVDKLFFDLTKSTEDTETLYIVTADHGLIDSSKDRILDISDFPAIKECLVLPLCGEPRVPYCYVRPAKYEQFIHAVDDHLGAYCDRYSLNEVLSRNLFGIGKRNSKLYDRIGDEVLIMKDNFVLLDRVYHEQQKDFVGFHGGLSKDEMLIPLIFHF